MQTFLMLAILLSLVASLILLLVFHDMKIDNRKWHMNIAIFVFLFLLVNALAYSYEAEREKNSLFSDAGCLTVDLVVHRRCNRWIAYLGRI